MTWSIPLFTFKGIEVRVHLTFALILFWAAYRWGVALRIGPAGALYGVVVIVLLFVCVTIHEFSHSLMAMRFGVKVKGITLLPIGGIAQMEEMPKKPREELLMALAGPVSNFVIAGLLLGVSLFFNLGGGLAAEDLPRALETPSWAGLVSYLILANLILGIFNLIPAYPMDGGRVLRSALALRMDHAKATALAVTIGQGLAWIMGLIGILSGAWTLVLIAILIFFGAGQEGRASEMKSVLGNLKVRQAVTREVETLAPDDPLSKAVDRIMSGFQTDFPVVDEGRLVGFLGEIDLVSALRENGPGTAVRRAMRPEFVTVSPDEPLFEAQQKMSISRQKALPVVRDGSLVGMITAQDVGEAYLFLSIRPDLVKKT